MMTGLVLFMSCQSEKTDWKLVWEENFEQTDSFDPAVWSKIPRGTSDWDRHMSDFDSCYAMRDGKLILRGLVNYTQKNDTSPVLTGGVYSKGKNCLNMDVWRSMLGCMELGELGLLSGCCRKMKNGQMVERLILWND